MGSTLSLPLLPGLPWPRVQGSRLTVFHCPRNRRKFIEDTKSPHLGHFMRQSIFLKIKIIIIIIIYKKRTNFLKFLHFWLFLKIYPNLWKSFVCLIFLKNRLINRDHIIFFVNFNLDFKSKFSFDLDFS